MPVVQNGLDFARPPDFRFLLGGEENAALPHFPPLPNNRKERTPSEVEVRPKKIWLLVELRIYIFFHEGITTFFFWD
ncbi:MAG: hypothetical protein B7Z16_13165 [Algoriphagus sp. 32-45-6]|nr:MAG: hypothetical protein B7Z16_13165 [Algoriphagus sp. 32-45-6]